MPTATQKPPTKPKPPSRAERIRDQLPRLAPQAFVASSAASKGLFPLVTLDVDAAGVLTDRFARRYVADKLCSTLALQLGVSKDAVRMALVELNDPAAAAGSVPIHVALRLGEDDPLPAPVAAAQPPRKRHARPELLWSASREVERAAREAEPPPPAETPEAGRLLPQGTETHVTLVESGHRGRSS